MHVNVVKVTVIPISPGAQQRNNDSGAHSGCVPDPAVFSRLPPGQLNAKGQF